MFESPCFHCRELRLDPWLGNKDPESCAVWTIRIIKLMDILPCLPYFTYGRVFRKRNP